MYTFTMVGCTLFKLCHCKCAKAYLLEILGMSRLWHDLMARGHLPLQITECQGSKCIDRSMDKQAFIQTLVAWCHG